jgi:ABC-type dipeptide/oligopeptide/nickel transport system permease component
LRDACDCPVHLVTAVEPEDYAERIAKRVAIWAALGFAVPIFWGVMAFIFFNAREARWTDLFWYSVYVTCPPWLLPENSWSLWITPVANAALYGIVAFLISMRIRALKKRDH